MNLDEVRHLLEQFRAQERGESASQEIKRQWWNLKEEVGLQEFLRDIAAMANADTDDEKIILIGVKGDQLHDAPLPEDEAQLQTRLQYIEPRPRVQFTEFLIETGLRVSLVQILPPYDKPYIITFPKSKQQIPVRRGSMTGAATRRELDHWYKTSQAGLQIQLLWNEEEVVVDKRLVFEAELLEIERDESINRLSRGVSSAIRDAERLASWFGGDAESYVAQSNKWVSVDGFGLENNGRMQLRDIIVDIDVEPNARLAGIFPLHRVVGSLNPGYTVPAGALSLELTAPVVSAPIELTISYCVGAHTGVLSEGKAHLDIVFRKKMISLKEAQELARRFEATRMLHPGPR